MRFFAGKKQHIPGDVAKTSSCSLANNVASPTTCNEANTAAFIHAPSIAFLRLLFTHFCVFCETVFVFFSVDAFDTMEAAAYGACGDLLYRAWYSSLVATSRLGSATHTLLLRVHVQPRTHASIENEWL